MQSCARVEFATEPLGSITGLLKFAIQGYDLPVWRVSAGQPALVEPWRKASAIVLATPPGQHRLGQLLGELPRRCQMGDEESAITDIMLEFWQHIEPAWRESGHRSLGSLEEALHTLMSAFRLRAIRPLSIQERAQYENISELQPYRNIMHLICPGIQRANGQIIIKAKVEIE